MQGSGLAKLYNQQGNTCSEATVSFADKTIDEVTGAGGRMIFALSRDDKDWRFIMSNTDLTTEREGRKLRILAPSPLVNYDDKAEIWMITGQCIMTRAPPPLRSELSRATAPQIASSAVFCYTATECIVNENPRRHCPPIRGQ